MDLSQLLVKVTDDESKAAGLAERINPAMVPQAFRDLGLTPGRGVYYTEWDMSSAHKDLPGPCGCLMGLVACTAIGTSKRAVIGYSGGIIQAINRSLVSMLAPGLRVDPCNALYQHGVTTGWDYPTDEERINELNARYLKESVINGRQFMLGVTDGRKARQAVEEAGMTVLDLRDFPTNETTPPNN